MSAPTPTDRVTPSGRLLGDGYKTLVTLAIAPDIDLWEVSVTPPGVDGGDPNETRNMHSNVWVTKSPRALKEMTDMTFVAQYDPRVYDDIVDCINVPTTITILFPDGQKLAYYGYLRSAIPNENVEGTEPTLTCTVVATMRDPITCTEEGPTIVPASGTALSC